MKRRWSSADRKARKMAREHEAEFSIVVRPEMLDKQLERGFSVEASGWKGAAGTAMTSTPETERFYRGVANAFNRDGKLAVSEILLDGRCVAFDLCLLQSRRLYLLKTGFDESFGPLSPGLVLRHEVVRKCFETDIDAHELLGDDSDWKRRFATGERAHITLRFMSRSPQGLVRYAYRRFAHPHLRSAYRAARSRLGR